MRKRFRRCVLIPWRSGFANVWFRSEGEQLLRLEPSGAARRTADFDEFETIDPQYAVPLEWIEGNQIRLEGKIFYGSDQEAIACLAQAQSRLESEKQLLRMQLDDIYASRTWKLRQTIRKIFGK